MYKVFLNNYFIVFGNCNSFSRKCDCKYCSLFLVKKRKNKIVTIDELNYIIHKKIKVDSNFFIISEKFVKLFYDFKSRLKNISAAGGLVLNAENKILTIYKNNVWDLPKGKVQNENILEAAVREIKEETNADVDLIKKNKIITWHIYYEIEQINLKETSWFLMRIKNNSSLIPQKEESITNLRWADVDEFQNLKTYNSIKEVVLNFINLMY